MQQLLLKIPLIYCCLCSLSGLWAQSIGLPLGNDAYHILDRMEILTGVENPIHSSIKYFSREDVTNYTKKVEGELTSISILDKADIRYIYLDNNDWVEKKEDLVELEQPKLNSERTYIDSTKTFYVIDGEHYQDNEIEENKYVESDQPFLKYFYKTPANFFEINKKSFYLKANPIINFKIFKDIEDENLNFINQRGIELRGGIDRKVYFYSNILESQARFPSYVSERIERDLAVPGAGFYKDYKSSIFEIENAYDFLNSQAYIGANLTKHIGVQFGYGQNFIGNGYRSFFLSDYANNYLYLKFNTRVWKFHYQNIFAELSIFGNRDESYDLLIPKKYMSAHYLSFKPTKNLSLGFFEATVFARENHFEFQYLNPVILYRTAEQALGSEDNILIGFDAKWNIKNSVQLYGQVMLDEFKFKELFLERNGWWANKFAVQAGLKYINVLGIDHLDLQLEYNLARPYTFSHKDSTANYSHYNQPLAHPLGANFREVVGKLRYQPLEKMVLDGRFISIQTGENGDSTNWGANILLPNTNFEQEYGNTIGQGIAANILLIGMDISYQIRHNLFLELNYLYRKKDSEDNSLDLSTHYFGGGFRFNISKRRNDF